MDRKNILFVFGTRPEVIKLAPVILELKKYSEKYNVIICNTEQQKELSNQTLSYFGLQADINLDVMRPNQSLLGVQTRILTALDSVYSENKIDATIVQGDTMTVLCGALASFYNKIPVFHVEAGLRSYDIYEPFPEEVMRQMTSRVAELHFAPTEKNRQALLKENIDNKKIHVVGNTVIDALFCLSDETMRDAEAFYHNQGITIDDKIVLITAHRRENHGERIDRIIEAIKYLAEKYPESFDKAVPEELVYSGTCHLNDEVEGSPINAGKLVLSPTRTYAPVIKRMLDEMRPKIHGMVHCTGGAQTKVLHFVGDNCKVVKDNMFPVPPLFKLIAKESNTDWSEMYKVFNMGHRMEIYVSPEDAEQVISISKSFNIDAQIVGHIEEGKKSLTIKSEFGEFNY